MEERPTEDWTLDKHVEHQTVKLPSGKVLEGDRVEWSIYGIK